jgi:hypothetical protein
MGVGWERGPVALDPNLLFRDRKFRKKQVDLKKCEPPLSKPVNKKTHERQIDF